MEKEVSGREWRKSVKKMQRKRRRQKDAKKRDKRLEEEEEASRRTDPAYIEWQQRQDELERFQREAEEKRRADKEEAWVRRELLAQRQFALEQQRRSAEEAEREALQQRQLKELEEREAAQAKRREEQQRRVDAASAEFELTMQRMQAYLESTTMLVPPLELRRWVESRPSEKMCEMFQRTNCCRYGMSCQFNHRRPLLSSIILVRHFYTHPLLEHSAHSEYAAADAMLELSERDLRADYDTFFNDVVPELEGFGKMLNFRTVCNTQSHLSGNAFVEYAKEKSALKAFIRLQGRYYAGKRLNVEFSNLATWRGAICGMWKYEIICPRQKHGKIKHQGLSLNRKCPKGKTCNYLHLFRNPGNKYNTLLEYTKPTGNAMNRMHNSRTPTSQRTLSWNDVNSNLERVESRNWRWSASPDLDLPIEEQTITIKCDKNKAHNRHSRRKDPISSRSTKPKCSCTRGHNHAKNKVQQRTHRKEHFKSKSRK